MTALQGRRRLDRRAVISFWLLIISVLVLRTGTAVAEVHSEHFCWGNTLTGKSAQTTTDSCYAPVFGVIKAEAWSPQHSVCLEFQIDNQRRCSSGPGATVVLWHSSVCGECADNVWIHNNAESSSTVYGNVEWTDKESSGSGGGGSEPPPGPYVPQPGAVVDSAGITHMYYRGPNEDLEEWYQSGSTWQHREWGTSGSIAGTPSAVLGPEGRIYVYYRSPNGQLRDWWFKGSEWGQEDWGYTSAMGGDPSAIVDGEGKRFVYYRDSSGQLEDWWFKGSSWGQDSWGYTSAMDFDHTAIDDGEGKRFVY
jgi:hypothetical protein